jgi:hypothetical protein
MHHMIHGPCHFERLRYIRLAELEARKTLQVTNVIRRTGDKVI